MAPELYDVFWQWPLEGEQASKQGQLHQLNVLKQPVDGISAMILYPALLTPDVAVGQDDSVELLVLVEDKAKLKPMDVNRQLKVWKGLNPSRKYYDDVLITAEDPPYTEVIKVKKLGNLAANKPFKSWKWEGESASEGRFCGMLDTRAVELYKDKGFTKLYAVWIKIKSIRDSLDNQQEDKKKEWYDSRFFIEPKSCLDQNQDYIVHWAVKNGDTNRAQHEGRFGYTVGGQDVEAGNVDPNNPVQAYHPVFYYDNLEHASVGHMADIHLSARQQILAKSKARVIECPEDHCAAKQVGKMFNICSKNTKYLLDQFGGGGTNGVDIVVVSGDTVDFIRNVYDDGKKQDWQPPDVWKYVGIEGKSGKVALDDKTKSWHLEKHWENVDFLSLYSLVGGFYKDTNKRRPVYAVNGNHDCYLWPFGISPHVISAETKKANEGIPADHNLTIYEANLAFGPTYHTLVKWSNNHPEKFAWFYTVFTPFSDFCVKLPKQSLVGLAWGDDEDMISAARAGGQGFGHLPRANKAISDTQMGFLDKHVIKKAENRKVILASHFTFASYIEGISEKEAAKSTWGDKNDQGDVYYARSKLYKKDFSKADMGTFHLNREKMYKEWVYGKKIHCILTGHSHRRGLYVARRLDIPTIGNDSVKTGFYVFPPLTGENAAEQWMTNKISQSDKRKLPPYIIVSDSGGSVPRRNVDGEFSGWGSDQPSGTKVVFNGDGKVKYVGAVQVPICEVNTKPRFAVALDYWDIMEGSWLTDTNRVIYDFSTTSAFTTKQEKSHDWTPRFALHLRKEVRQYQVKPTEVSLHWLDGNSWKVIKMTGRGETTDRKSTLWEIPAKKKQVFEGMAGEKERNVFLSIKFSSNNAELNKIYEFDTPWTFEAQVDKKKSGVDAKLKFWQSEWTRKFTIKRDFTRAQYPDFKKRKKYYAQHRL
jgi:hypothetical protein